MGLPALHIKTSEDAPGPGDLFLYNVHIVNVDVWHLLSVCPSRGKVFHFFLTQFQGLRIVDVTTVLFAKPSEEVMFVIYLQ